MKSYGGIRKEIIEGWNPVGIADQRQDGDQQCSECKDLHRPPVLAAVQNQCRKPQQRKIQRRDRRHSSGMEVCQGCPLLEKQLIDAELCIEHIFAQGEDPDQNGERGTAF